MSSLPIARTGAAQELSAASTRQYLTFNLGGEAFAIPIEHVREIIEFNALTTIPMMPAFLRGVLNLRGAVVPVIDLQTRFGRAATDIARRTCVIIIELREEDEIILLGVMVDAVSEVLTLDRSKLEPRPAFGTHIRADFIDGILNLDGRFVIALDVRQVLSISEMSDLIGIAHDGDAKVLSESASS